MIFAKRSALTLLGLGCSLVAHVGCADDAQTEPPVTTDPYEVMYPDGTSSSSAGPGASTPPQNTGGVIVQPSNTPLEPGSEIVDRPEDNVPEEEMVCESGSTPTSLQGVVLAFAFDVSGSMGANNLPYYSRELKWEPVVAATKAFFASPASAGVQATLTFFPNEGAEPATEMDDDDDMMAGGFGGGMFGGGGGFLNVQDPALMCDMQEYATADVPVTELPSDAFAQAIDLITPATDADWRVGTPTVPVITGTIEFVQGLREQDPSKQYVIVLVTDGEPTACEGDGNTVAGAAAAAEAVADDIPTYVIGVQNPVTDEEPNPPDAVTSLNAIAVGGGTEEAFIINTDDPAKTAADFQAVIDKIRESTFTCNLPIPAAPAGQTFDPAKVNVKYANMVGETAFVYDETCTERFAWHYDDPANPTVIQMCGQVCDDIRADYENAGELNVEFGCVRRVPGAR